MADPKALAAFLRYHNDIQLPDLPSMTVTNGTRIVPVTKVLVPPAK